MNYVGVRQSATLNNGYRLRCRSEIGRKNEVQAKISMFNLFLLARGGFLWND